MPAQNLSAPFQRQVLETPPEAPFELRFFITAVKTDSRGRVITGPTSEPVKNILGAERAGERGGLDRFWPHVKQPFRSQPRAMTLAQDGKKLYVTLPGREGYSDRRVAVVDAASRRVLKWIDLRPAGESKGLRPIGVKAAPVNQTISSFPYVVVLNQYGNFASVINAQTDEVVGEFETGFYGETLVFNSTGTRLYVTDRY